MKKFLTTAIDVLIVLAVMLLGVLIYKTAFKHGKDHQRITYTTIPPITLTRQTIDAQLGSEFSLTLTSNVDVGIIHMENGRMVNLTVTNREHSIRFTNPIAWLPSNTIPYAASNSVTLFNFIQHNNTIWGNVMRQIVMEVTNTEFKMDLSREPTNWVASGSSNVYVAGNTQTNDFQQVVLDSATGNIFVWSRDRWIEYVEKEKYIQATNRLTN